MNRLKSLLKLPVTWLTMFGVGAIAMLTMGQSINPLNASTYLHNVFFPAAASSVTGTNVTTTLTNSTLTLKSGSSSAVATGASNTLTTIYEKRTGGYLYITNSPLVISNFSAAGSNPIAIMGADYTWKWLNGDLTLVNGSGTAMSAATGVMTNTSGGTLYFTNGIITGFVQP